MKTGADREGEGRGWVVALGEDSEGSERNNVHDVILGVLQRDCRSVPRLDMSEASSLFFVGLYFGQRDRDTHTARR